MLIEILTYNKELIDFLEDKTKIKQLKSLNNVGKIEILETIDASKINTNYLLSIYEIMKKKNDEKVNSKYININKIDKYLYLINISPENDFKKRGDFFKVMNLTSFFFIDNTNNYFENEVSYLLKIKEKFPLLNIFIINKELNNKIMLYYLKLFIHGNSSLIIN